MTDNEASMTDGYDFDATLRAMQAENDRLRATLASLEAVQRDATRIASLEKSEREARAARECCEREIRNLQDELRRWRDKVYFVSYRTTTFVRRAPSAEWTETPATCEGKLVTHAEGLRAFFNQFRDSAVPADRRWREVLTVVHSITELPVHVLEGVICEQLS